MAGKIFKRKHKEDRPVLAICYDFDKTLSPDNMQEHGYIQSVGYDPEPFWTESNALAEKNDMDQNLAYMFKMVAEAEDNIVVTRKTLAKSGEEVKFFPGVEDWFERIREYGDKHGVIIEHYIISSGLKEMIEGTEIARKGAFEKIYASSFYFNERGVATWPAQVVNYTNKTQFLFRIEKGVLDVNDPGVNDYFQPDEIRVPFRNMIYIGDSDTDIPCMKLVNTYGGHSIGVFNPEKNDKKKVHKMMQDNRIKYFAPADYSENSGLDKLVKTIIDRTAVNEKLESIHYKDKNEAFEENELFDRYNDRQKQESLIAALENSRNFASTHTIIKELNSYTEWAENEKEVMFNAALNNQQIRWILSDWDVKKFYEQLLEGSKNLSQTAEEVREILENGNDID